MNKLTDTASDMSKNEALFGAASQTAEWTKPTFESFPLNEALATPDGGGIDGAVFKS